MVVLFQWIINIHCDRYWVSSRSIWIHHLIYNFLSRTFTSAGIRKHERSRWKKARYLFLRIQTYICKVKQFFYLIGIKNLVENGLLVWPATLLGSNIGRRCCRCWFEQNLTTMEASKVEIFIYLLPKWCKVITSI